ncbi:MAG: DNA polymerase III subunit alpha [Acholeplasmatales bacterium]|nr:DNA polymerase III subunit alpha [Acholeplasmatales bacterium]
MIGFFYAQSEYSITNNIIHLADLIEKAKEYGYKFLALADNKMHSFYKAITLCENACIKPIIGLEIEVEGHNLLLYAKSNIGLKNLFKISSKKEIEKLDFKFLKKNNEDIFMVTPGSNGFIEKNIVEGNLDKVFEVYLLYKDTFKEFYMGLEKQTFPFDEYYDTFKGFAISNKIKYLPIHRTLYLNEKDIDTFIVLKKINKEKIDSSDCIDKYLKTIDNLELEFNDPDCFKYVEELYNSVDIKVDRITNPLIKYPSGKDISSINYLTELCYLGLKKRLNNDVKKEYLDRLNYELSVIKKMGYEDYFLIVFDFIRFAKKNDILVGPGRGSAAGSLVAYSIGISEVDPIKYNLYFERFLNPERITMPDIDVDLPDERRIDVINYIIGKYGDNHVSFISTFDSFKGKSAINDVSKALGLDEKEIEEIQSKCLVFDKETGKKEVTKSSILNAYNNEEIDEYKEVLLHSYKLFDIPKSISTHAAGIILSSDEVTDNYPIMKSNNGYQSQIEAFDLEELGLLKMDLLSLKNLTLLDKIVKLTNVSLKDINLDDQKTFDLLNKADTKGIFQLEGRGVTNVLRKYNVTSFMDLANLLALYRPGPMDQIDEYIERKKGKEYSIPVKELEYILKPTYGIIVYQEQIMQIAHDYASYSLGEADVLRRAISKKKKEVLDLERERFVSRCNNEKEANMIYDYIVKFASYGFNKSHSVSYAMLTYYLAYFKANYYKEFVLVFLNDAISDIKGSINYYNDLKQNDINVINPNINYSTDEYIIKDSDVYLPLSIIKSINKEIVSQILEERKNGLFKSFTDFYNRVKLTNEQYNNLIYSSCFDGCIKDMINYVSFPSLNNQDIIKGVEFSYDELVKFEEDALGFNLKFSILNMYKVDNTVLLSNLSETDKQNVLVHIKYVKEITTKKNELMAFITIYDGKMSLEVNLFPSKFKDIMSVINSKGKVRYDKDVFLVELKPNLRGNVISYEITDIKKMEK